MQEQPHNGILVFKCRYHVTPIMYVKQVYLTLTIVLYVFGNTWRCCMISSVCTLNKVVILMGDLNAHLSGNTFIKQSDGRGTALCGLTTLFNLFNVTILEQYSKDVYLHISI